MLVVAKAGFEHKLTKEEDMLQVRCRVLRRLLNQVANVTFTRSVAVNVPKKLARLDATLASWGSR